MTEWKSYAEVFGFCVVIAFFAGLIAYSFIFLLEITSIYRIALR